MSITKRRVSGFKITRLDENNIRLDVLFPQGFDEIGESSLILTDGEFDVLMETIIAFTDSEAERPPIHFVGSA